VPNEKFFLQSQQAIGCHPVMRTPNSAWSATAARWQRFPTTAWTVVLQAGEQSPSALESLCARYREPLLSYLRADDCSEHDAEDEVQEFLLAMTKPGFLANVSQDGGLFRSWLLKSLKHQVTDSLARRHAAKRGGGRPAVPLDAVSSGSAAGQTVADGRRTPEEEYEHRWAVTVLANAWQELRGELSRLGRQHWADLLEPVLYRDGDRESYRGIAPKIGRTESGARSAAQRLRERLAVLIRDEVARTVANPEANPAEVEAELERLLRVVSR
jgi:RNA polymerase sigma-70 factor (ECF subfamily)